MHLLTLRHQARVRQTGLIPIGDDEFGNIKENAGLNATVSRPMLRQGAHQSVVIARLQARAKNDGSVGVYWAGPTLLIRDAPKFPCASFALATGICSSLSVFF